MAKLIKTTPVPIEFNGNGYLYECSECKKPLTILTVKKPTKCWYCGAEFEQGKNK